MLLWTTVAAHAAGCTPIVAGAPRVWHAALAADEAKAVEVTFLGHASYLIESPGGVSAVTDYGGDYDPGFIPDIVTMNHAHSMHYTDYPDPRIKFVLRGWDPEGGVAHHDLTFGDMRVRNVPTNIRDWSGGTEFAGNSIFVFETAQLCIAHLGHLHHTLAPEQLAALGQIDVLMVPIDGTYTMSHRDMIEVIEQIKPALVLPMHFFAQSVMARFVARLDGRYPIRRLTTPHLAISRADLPKSTEFVVLPGE